MNDQTMLGIVQNVTSRLVNKKDGTQFTIYDIDTTVGKMSATRREVAESAHNLIGQTSELRFNVKQNGNFTNYYLNAILPAPANPAVNAQRAQEGGDFLSQVAGIQPSQITQPLTTSTGNGLTATLETPVFTSSTADKDTKIHRQCATKVAAVMSDNPHDFWSNVDSLMAFYETGTKPTDSDIPF